VSLLRRLLPASHPHVLVEALKMRFAVLAGNRTRSPFNYMDQLISKKDIQHIFGVSKSSVQRWIQRPDFPKAFALNSRVLRWERIDVEAWFLSKQEAPRLVRTVSRKTGNQIVIDGVVIRRVS
jgi:predicted DNA-binding transcriptional regulator AlpA